MLCQVTDLVIACVQQKLPIAASWQDPDCVGCAVPDHPSVKLHRIFGSEGSLKDLVFETFEFVREIRYGVGLKILRCLAIVWLGLEI